MSCGVLAGSVWKQRQLKHIMAIFVSGAARRLHLLIDCQDVELTHPAMPDQPAEGAAYLTLKFWLHSTASRLRQGQASAPEFFTRLPPRRAAKAVCTACQNDKALREPLSQLPLQGKMPVAIPSAGHLAVIE